ncbi:nucleoside kinase [Porphyromonas endodontalis]|uniref:Phosphoribulokinase/uridine kinase family protein n=1 Tax=Porphyromonas endodontalis (strain ATCC 35406 / DSM 24491 / JCM 8526 / CCUG 16442 / BCRC 14492 / NCTC 13058 / HG 370) TaxID=553175 RepID=C3JBT7_POREA|nr:nucleoside kinase [Porphyromonas endodontalis]EEN82429.1 phosphoribulokinase/uridine kinase family protein [Porphyromonas endodontalis ATCC 35406]UBH64167.1 nucleoside kinase [Porphyromonas endodontalis]SUB67560.1 Uridine kinase [Porphyromonas endodontalis]
MDPIQIICTNTGYKELVNKGITILELAKKYEQELGFKPINCRMNNNTVGLTEKITKSCELFFVGLNEESGQRTYFRTLSFILSKAVREVIPTSRLRVEHSLSNGYYCSIKNGHEVTDQELANITIRMDEIIAADLPFVTRTASQEEAVKVFRDLGEEDKATLLETYNVPFITYQELDGYPDTYYGSLAPSTGYIHIYSIERYLDGFLVRVPSRTNPNELAPLTEQPKLREVLKDQKELIQMLEIPYVGDLNKAITRGEINDIIMVSEAEQEKKISMIAQEIAQRYHEDGVRIVLISGPSSSGKTTFTKRLYTQLRTCFIKPHSISLDDYFVNRDRTPRDENGEYDFESLYAVDLDAFNQDLQKLLRGESVELPTFDFKLGVRSYRNDAFTLRPGDLLLIEGIHALNPELIPTIPTNTTFKIYVSALTAIGLDAHNRIPTTDNRLLRRIVRDYRYRGKSAVETLFQWASVRRGEERWVFPYQENADRVFNSAMVYELAALRRFAEPLLMEVPANVPEYSEAQRLLRFLRMIHYIRIDKLPGTSLIREFLGGSAFRY